MTAAPRQSFLSWPPPGLEVVHGKLWPVIAILGLGDVVLVLPFLAALGTEQEFTSMGPFGRHWWIVLLTTVFGIGILTLAGQRMIALLWRAGRGAKDGHGWRVILYAMADESRDAGFLLQGARHFAVLGPRERRVVLSLRLWAAGLTLAAVLLAPLSVAVGALLGSRGWIESVGFWTLAAWLPLALVLLGFVARLMAYALARTARGTPEDRAAHAAVLEHEIADWTARSAEMLGAGGPDLGARGKFRAFRVAAVVGEVVGALVVLSVAALAVAGSIGPVLMSIAVPRFVRIQGRVFEAQLFTPYAAPVDAAVTARTAGEALQALLLAGEDSVPAFMQAPVRRYDHFVQLDTLPDGTNLSPQWLSEQFRAGGRRLSPAERRALREAASHPALRELATIASAPAVDIVGTRYVLPFPESATPISLPFPRFSALREAARARLGGALVDLAEGRPALAERGVREVISTGLALMREGPTLIEALFGAVITRQAGDALEALFRATGRAPEADHLAAMRERTRFVADQLSNSGIGGSVEEALAAMPRIVTDTTMLRGLRWEFYVSTRTFAPCSNLHTMVFGPGESYAEWVAAAHASLVRRDSDQQLFDFLGRGFLGTGGCIPLLSGLRQAGVL